MKIISWNINWIHKNINKNQNRIEENEKRVKVAIDIIQEFNPDILSLLEAGISESPEIEGYNKICLDRKYIYNGYKNGIVVYIKNDYKYRIDEDVLKEIKAKNVGCFLPITIYKYNEFFNCFFVWTTVKNRENGQYVPYGYNRIKEILELEKTVEFLNAKEKNVIFIGDFNLVSNHKNSQNKQEI